MTTVVKLGGRVQSDPSLPGAVAKMWRESGGSLCIVHGGGDELSLLQRRLGREPEFVNGRRITTEDDLELVRMVLSGSSNKRLVAALAAAGLPAVGISGEDGDLLAAEPFDGGSFGRAGTPAVTNTAIVEALLLAGFLPVISPVARDATSSSGEPMNVNGDDAAAAIAASMGAALWMISDVEGVLDGETPLPRLDEAMMESLVTDGTVSSGMRAKLEAGFSALVTGATVVRIASMDAFSNPRAGTFLLSAAGVK